MLFKCDNVTEPYILFNIKRWKRSLCAQLKTGTLTLAVEVGQIIGTPEHLRLWEFCDVQVEEDEFNFLYFIVFKFWFKENSLFQLILLKYPDLFWKPEAEMLFDNNVFLSGKICGKGLVLAAKYYESCMTKVPFLYVSKSP